MGGDEGFKKVNTAPLLPTADSKELTFEEKLDLITASRSIDNLLKWAHFFVKSEYGILCSVCGTVLQYDYNNGENFTESAMPDSFRHLKYDLKRHILSGMHKESVNKHEEKELVEELLSKEGKANALNCASAAYLTYKLNNSYKAYESIIATLHSTGSNVGVSNHSKEFPRLFLPHVHSVLKKEISSFIIDNELPVGIFADKITINHRSRHIVGLRVPVFDVTNPNLFNCIYLEHNFVKDYTGKGLTTSILNTCNKFGFDALFLRNSLVGMAFDGQYIQLGVQKHMKEELVLKDISVTWDIMHRIELAEKHSYIPDVIQKGHNLINEAMKEFSTGKKYELLLLASKQFEEYFYKPKPFKSMKFATYSESVFKTFLADYKSIVCAAEQNEESFGLRDRLISKSNIFCILLLADIYSILSYVSKEVQSSYHLPWEYLTFMRNMEIHLETMIGYVKEISTSETRACLYHVVSKLPEAFFKHTKLSLEFISEKGTFKGVPLPDEPVSSKKLRSHSSTSTDSDDPVIVKCAGEFFKFLESLREQCRAYLNPDENNQSVKVMKIAELLFSFDFMIFPRNDISNDIAEKSFVSVDDFFDAVGVCSYSFLSTVDKMEMLFEYKQVVLWLIAKMDSARSSGNSVDFKHVLKVCVTELQCKFPLAIKLLKWLITTPVSEAICESWGSIISNVMTKRPAASDMAFDEIGTTDMLAYIQINGPPAGYQGNQKFLKAALIQKYGLKYHCNFKPVSNNKIMTDSITSKVVSRITNDLGQSLPCFKFKK